MNAFGIIYIIIVIAIVRGTIKNAKKKNMNKEQNDTPNASTNPGSRSTAEDMQTIMKRFGNTNHNTTTVTKTYTSNTSSTVRNTTAAKKTMDTKKSTDAKISTGKKDAYEDLDTMEYLREKAAADEREHKKTEYEAQLKQRRMMGNIRVAGRLYPGDPVPKGQSVCICHYCAAENLIPYNSREVYYCYFCREKL